MQPSSPNRTISVYLASPLRSYARGSSEVFASGATVDELLQDLDLQFPGVRWRMIDEQRRVRPHMRIFVNDEQVFALDSALRPTDRVQILAALSGG